MPVPGCDRCGAFPRRSVYHDWEYQNSAALGRLRASNFLATDQEVFYIQNVVSTLDNDISHMESKMLSLRRVINSMKAERDALKNVKHNYNVLISPYRRIPPEVWSRIFLFTQEEERDFNSYAPSGVIWHISHVCQMWRNVALSLQAFWARLELEFPADSQPEDDNVLELALKRSHPWPLDISVTSNGLSPRFDPPNCNPAIRDRVLGMLFAESYRWKTVSLTELRLNSDALYAPLQGPLPMLESCSCIQGLPAPKACDA
ncbi:hypothetical protein BDZ89DRAFT_499831 [Hymenopellis radicata]|nr:hypothetical protein BDZ89DRAFT_499831 [Hymenopellis radicata]